MKEDRRPDHESWHGWVVPAHRDNSQKKLGEPLLSQDIQLLALSFHGSNAMGFVCHSRRKHQSKTMAQAQVVKDREERFGVNRQWQPLLQQHQEQTRSTVSFQMPILLFSLTLSSTTCICIADLTALAS